MATRPRNAKQRRLGGEQLEDRRLLTGAFAPLVTDSINAPPTLNPIGNLVLPLSSGLQSVNLTGIGPGAANEAGQIVTISAISSNPGLIPNPVVNYSSSNSAGTLTFTPAAKGSGMATLTVTAHDDGGTANGGSDTTVQSFTVQVVVSQGGTWADVSPLAPESIEGAMLLSDGSVMAHGGYNEASRTWYRLTPDASGSYANATWSNLAPMSLGRYAFPSNVLTSGKVLVLGGEYSGPTTSRTYTNQGEIYDPVANRWSPMADFPNPNFGDDPTAMLPDGKLLAGYLYGPQTYLYDPTTNTWSQTGTKLRSERSDEETWTLLPDGSVLSYDIFASIASGVGSAQRYLPATGQWVDAGVAPVALSAASTGYEIGPGMLLPDGRVLLLGATGNTAFYNSTTNRWTAGPVIPQGLGSADSPGAVLPNGDVLFAASPIVTDGATFNGPTRLFEFNPTTNTYFDVTPPLGDLLAQHAFLTTMLVLPSGQVLLTLPSNLLELYTPLGTPQPSWQPTISSVIPNGANSFTLTGTQLNGLSEGASYGDDAEMSSNYPIVRLTSQTGQVSFARTFNWSTGGVTVGNTPETVQFALPAGLGQGTYQLSVVTNGIASAPVNFTFDTVSPTVSIAPLTPNPRTTPVAQMTIRFSEAVTGFDLGDLQLTANGGADLLVGSGATLTSSDQITWTLGNLTSVTGKAASYVLTLDAAGAGIADLAGNALVTSTSASFVVNSTIAGRAIFYNNSKFDGNAAAANSADDAAIAPDKTALLPGQTATFANYTSYSRGINGVIIDVAGLSATPLARDFVFKLGNSNSPSGWATAPAPASITVRFAAGVGGSDRVSLIWPDGAIQNEWLQIEVLADRTTGLAADDVFYFGNAVADAGDSTSDVFVNATDELLARHNPRSFLNPAPIIYPYDFNRDGFVDATDQLLARHNPTNFLNALELITVPGAGPPASASLNAAAVRAALAQPDVVEQAAAVVTPSTLR